MSIINLELQGVAIMRDIMSTELEDIFKKVDTLEEIRAAAAKNEDLKNELHDCILNIQQLLHSRTERLVLYENPFCCYDPASNHDIDNFFKIKKCNDVNCNVCKQVWLPQHIFENIDFLSDPIPLKCKYCQIFTGGDFHRSCNHVITYITQHNLYLSYL
ncbi:hypothetical protein RhiirA5_413708 [Rhizophagus irregularis]|uniref:Uncharacterized protein n=1 Tax=Rhizophagus irregularis TaxID=588596 RepID=A0A2N0PVW3_9GLOM|nr:hypothetical protein RhiirA5_413708 [Rhizophagus irregularis]